MDLLLFFALPVSTIILAIVFQSIIRNPILVAATAFAIYLIVTFTAFDASFLIFAIIYTIIAYAAASIYQIISDWIKGNVSINNLNTDNINTNILNTNQLNIDGENCNNCIDNNRSFRQRCNRYYK